MDQIEREEQEIERQYEEGELTAEEYRRELRDLYASAREHAEERAREAYDNEMERWGYRA